MPRLVIANPENCHDMGWVKFEGTLPIKSLRQCASSLLSPSIICRVGLRRLFRLAPLHRFRHHFNASFSINFRLSDPFLTLSVPTDIIHVPSSLHLQQHLEPTRVTVSPAQLPFQSDIRAIYTSQGPRLSPNILSAAQYEE